MKTLIYLSASLDSSSYGGSVVSKTNLKAIKKLPNLHVIEVAIVREIEGRYKNEILSEKSKIRTAINNSWGYAGRLSASVVAKIKEIIIEIEPDFLYLDSSLLGDIAKWCRNEMSNVKIITFFHNIEFDFEIARLKSWQIQYLPSCFASCISERKAVNFSDVVISLHQQDSRRLAQLYGRFSDYTIPICIDSGQDFINQSMPAVATTTEFVVGFLGTAFFANINAAKFISDQIAPIFSDDKNIKFIIAGSGFELYREKLEKPNVVVRGFVESLDSFYEAVDVVISPIFDGAGMKVKVAEALKYNKKIIASSFSLVGYEAILNSPDVVVCKSLDDYEDAVLCMRDDREKLASSRFFFDKYYSFSAAVEYFGAVFS